LPALLEHLASRSIALERITWDDEGEPTLTLRLRRSSAADVREVVEWLSSRSGIRGVDVGEE
jgi:hypothetical protein